MKQRFQVFDTWTATTQGRSETQLLITAGAAMDAESVDCRDAAVFLDGEQVAYAGPAAGAPACGEGVRRVALGDDWLILPGMVNAHAHLELTSIGPQPYGGDFLDWVGLVMRERPADEAAQAAAVAEGLRLSAAGGVAAVGDIGTYSGGSGRATAVFEGAAMAGVMFDEVLGLAAERWRPGLAAAAEWMGCRSQTGACGDPSGGASGSLPGGRAPSGGGGVGRSVEGHAPYTTALGAMLGAAERVGEAGGVLAVHAAELLEEDVFVRGGRGPFRERFEATGFWSEEVAGDYGRGLSPIEWLKPVLERVRCLVAHGNYLSDADIQILAETGASLVYCPMASAYFGHPQGGREAHRYRDLIDAGVNVCLGTDSLLCQPPEAVPGAWSDAGAWSDPGAWSDAGAWSDPGGGLSMWAVMRYLYARDRPDARRLLAMATTRGRDALGLGDAPWQATSGVDLKTPSVGVAPSGGGGGGRPGLGTLLVGAPARVCGVRFGPGVGVDPLTAALRLA